jgi:hypothetical protein
MMFLFTTEANSTHVGFLYEKKWRFGFLQKQIALIFLFIYMKRNYTQDIAFCDRK